MANPVKLRGDPAGSPTLQPHRPVTRPGPTLERALEAYQCLKLDVRAQSRPIAERREVTRFLRQIGALLHGVLFPEGLAGPGRTRPVAIVAEGEWAAYPWELMHDGEHWLALQQGVLRVSTRASPPPASTPTGGPRLRAAAVSADPLPGPDDAALAAIRRESGARFLHEPAELLDPDREEAESAATRHLPHATAEDWRALMADPPALLFWCGFADAREWWFETPRGAPAPIAADEMGGLLGRAVSGGLRTLVLADSLGLLDPATAAAQDEDWLETGLEGLIRLDGLLARLRTRDYLRALVRHLAFGESPFEAHLSAIRRLSRRFEEGWDWAFLRFHGGPQTAMAEPPPLGEVGPPRVPRPEQLARGELPPQPRPWAPHLRYPIPPAALRPRRRVFGRIAERRALLEALLPERPASSPYVFLSGPAGSGKTALARDLAQRVRRQFDEVIYLEARTLLPAPGDLLPAGDLPWRGGDPGERMLELLARHVGCVPDPAAGDAGPAAARGWAGALRAHLADGRGRLLILDGLERYPGYEACLSALQQVPAGSRVLAVARDRPPLLPGLRVELEPVSRAELAAIADPEFMERLAGHPAGTILEAACRRDLLAARLLSRAPDWPQADVLAGALQPAQGQSLPPPARLLSLAAAAALEALSEPAREVLAALVLPGGWSHRETLGRMVEVGGPALGRALAELQWSGLVEAFDDEQYLAVPQRVQAPLSQRLLDQAAFGRLAPRLVLAEQSFLAATAEALHHVHDPEPGRQGARALAWGPPEPEPPRESALPVLRRLAAERYNLAELSLMLAEEGDLRALGRLMEEARPLAALPWLADLHVLMGANQYAAATAARDEVAQAQALNRIGAAALAAGDATAALPPLERSLERIAHHDGWDTLWETYLLLSRAYERQAHYDAAENLLNSAVELAYQLGDGSRLVTALRALTRVWGRRGVQRELAGQVLPRAVTFLERREQRQQAALVRALLGECQLRSERLDEAEASYRQALDAFLQADDAAAAAAVGLGLAEVLYRQAQPDAAWRLARDAASVLGEAGDAHLPETLRVIEDLARWCEAHQRTELALECYVHLRALHERAGEAGRGGLIRVLDRLGGVYFQLGRQGDSTRCYEERLRLQTRDTRG